MYFNRLSLFLGALVLATISVSSARADAPTASTDIEMVKIACSYPSGFTGDITATIDDRGTGLSVFHFKDSRNSNLDFTLDELHKGVVIVHALGKDIVKIASPEFAADGGGQMILTFLKGFLGSDHRELRFDYIRRGSITDWVLQTDDSAGREPFDALSIFITKTLGLPTGIGGITLTSGPSPVRKYDPNTLPAPADEREESLTL